MRIIATLGPSSLNDIFFNECAKNNILHFRLNASHMTDEEIINYLQICRNNFKSSRPYFYLDLQGYKIRISGIEENKSLTRGEFFILSYHPTPDSDAIQIPNADFFRHTNIGDILHVQDGRILLEVVSKSGTECRVKVIQGHQLRPDAGICNPAQKLVFETFPTTQLSQIKIAARQQVDCLALSYTQSTQNLQQLRNHCSEINYFPKIAAKIEHPAALENLMEITEFADEIWLCRGDLGTFIPLKEIAFWQEKTIKIARSKKTPVIIAGQVFHHLTGHENPTRSEIVHFSLLQNSQCSGIVLSDETAIGKHPVNVIQKICGLL